MKTNSHQLKEYKKTLKLTTEQRSILVGILLGDAHLETQNKGQTYRLKFAQCVAHKPYLEHLYEIFKDWVLTPPKFKNSNKVWHFHTVSHGSFRFYGHQFYSTGIKRVPKLIHRWLTPKALAYWFMDDGSMKSKQSKGILLNTQGFDLADVKRLCELFETKFHLKAWPRKQVKKKRKGKVEGLDPMLQRPQATEYYQIYVSGHSYEQLRSLIYPYLVPEMLYKFPPARRGPRPFQTKTKTKTQTGTQTGTQTAAVDSAAQA